MRIFEYLLPLYCNFMVHLYDYFNNDCILKLACKIPVDSILSSCEPGGIQSDTPGLKPVAPRGMQSELIHQPRVRPTSLQSGPLKSSRPVPHQVPSCFQALSPLSFIIFHLSKKCKYSSLYCRSPSGKLHACDGQTLGSPTCPYPP